jgi:hypothetical protein
MSLGILNSLFNLDSRNENYLSVTTLPEFNFKPMVWIYRQDSLKFELNAQEFNLLVGDERYISSFFKLQANFYPHSFTSKFRARFERQFEENYVVLERKEGQLPFFVLFEFWITESVWEKIVTVMQCVQHELKTRKRWRLDVQDVFCDMQGELIVNHSVELLNSKKDVHYLSLMSKLNDLNYADVTESKLDQKRVFLEATAKYADFIVNNAKTEIKNCLCVRV